MSRLLLNAGAAPSTPAAGKAAIFFDTADGRLKLITDQGLAQILSQSDWAETILLNGGFDFAQRQAPGTLTTYSNTSGRTYAADRWGVTNENASVQYQRIDTQAAPETGISAASYGKWKKITSAGKMILSQVVEGSNTMPLRGRRVRMQFKVKISVAATMALRATILYLTSAGTIDTIPATFVSAFGAVGTDPTWGANLTALTPAAVEGAGATISGLGMSFTGGNTWVRYSGAFDIPANCKNIIACVWTNGQPAANDELNITEFSITDGVEVMDWTPRAWLQQLMLCQRYYFKTFLPDTAPVQNAGLGTGEAHGMVSVAAAVANPFNLAIRFPVPMRITPATRTLYNPAAANAFMRNITAASDATATAIANPSALGCSVGCTGIAAWTVGQVLGIHATFDGAEL